MERWRKILSRWGPRDDVGEAFYPEGLDVERPVLINSMGPMAAALVAARVLRAVVARRGSLVAPSAVEALEKLLCRGLSDEVIHHCQAEAERILEWMERRPPVDEATAEVGGPDADLELMMAADLESRLSVARFALDEGYELELEYFDEDTQTWPRVRAALIGIEGDEVADFDTAIRLRDREGEFDVELKRVRWLMPVTARPRDDDADHRSGGAEVVPFPGSDGDG